MGRFREEYVWWETGEVEDIWGPLLTSLPPPAGSELRSDEQERWKKLRWPQ